MTNEGIAITTQALAGRLGVAAPSVTQMLQRLSALGLVDHAPYREITLTPAGLDAAREVAERHDLIADYLIRVLGLSPDQGHDDADRLEHVISEQLKVKLTAQLQEV